MNEEMNIQENEITEVEVYDIPEKSGKGGIGVLAVCAAVAGGVALYLRATKDKRKQKKIEKLRKEGYVIYEPTKEIEVVDCDDVCEDEE